MILELMAVGALVGAFGGGTTFLGYAIGRRKKDPNIKDLPTKPLKLDALMAEATQEVEDFLHPPPPKETVPWSYNYIFGTSRCTKCKTFNRWKGKGYRICTCKDYPRAHFHITCPSCGYKVIMRTADDV